MKVCSMYQFLVLFISYNLSKDMLAGASCSSSINISNDADVSGMGAEPQAGRASRVPE